MGRPIKWAPGHSKISARDASPSAIKDAAAAPGILAEERGAAEKIYRVFADALDASLEVVLA